MKAEELRIGNIINYKGSPITVTMIGKFGVQSDDRNRIINAKFQTPDLTPIPINPELLLQMGFKYRNDARGLGAILDLKKPDLPEKHRWKFESSVAFVHAEENENLVFLTFLAHPTAYRMLYVHQVQNLYYALTGEELNYEIIN